MQRYWSQVAMLLLGVTLTVGFYEGRKLWKNTAKALTAATSISGSASGRRAARADLEDEPSDELADPEALAASDDDRGDRKRKLVRANRMLPGLEGEPGDVRAERLNSLRARQRARLSGRPGGPVGPVVPPPPKEEPADAPVDTGHEAPANP
ncbi:MAG: hypothetical protein ABMA64_13370 [Myxococcota bacterium]